MAKPKLNSFKLLFQSGKSFSITEEQYIKESGLKFPKQPYLQTSSPLAQMAKMYGYEIVVKNIVVFCKKRSNGNEKNFINYISSWNDLVYDDFACMRKK